MNKIRLTAKPEANYIFHMLSVSQCGYDNEYGKACRDRIDPVDLRTVREQAAHLTVNGGEYCGDWYGPMVCWPASGETSVPEYFSQVIRAVDEGQLEPEYTPVLPAIRAVSEVMIRNYEGYLKDIWPAEKARIEAYIPEVEAIFSNNEFTDRAEKMIGVTLPVPFFTASLVSSVSGGPEAIDITADQDVFGIGRSAADEARFIGHEFIIYLLKEALKNENAFRGFATWPATEGLAEFYLQRLLGPGWIHPDYAEYIALYEAMAPAPAADLCREALRQKEIENL